MPRYIDADDLAKVFMLKGKDKLRLATVINEIEMSPTADVVEVVRCKDCTRGFRKFLGKTDVVECQLYHHDDKRQYKDPMEFCSSGVRREEK